MISGHVFRKCFGGWNLHNTAGWLSGSSPQSLYKSIRNREAEHQCGSFGIRRVSGNPCCLKLLHQLCASSNIPHNFPWQRPILGCGSTSPRHCQWWHHIQSPTNEMVVLNDQSGSRIDPWATTHSSFQIPSITVMQTKITLRLTHFGAKDYFDHALWRLNSRGASMTPTPPSALKRKHLRNLYKDSVTPFWIYFL